MVHVRVFHSGTCLLGEMSEEQYFVESHLLVFFNKVTFQLSENYTVRDITWMSD